MVSILDRMLMREVIKTLAVIVIVLVLLILANTLVRLLDDTAAGLISSDLMLILLALNAIKLVGFMLPPALFFSILWVLGSMYRDSEMGALFAGGVSQLRLYRAFLLIALPVALVVAWLTLWVLPSAKSHADELKKEYTANINFSGIKSGAFNEFNKGELVIFAAVSDEKTGMLEQVFVQHTQNGKPGIVLANKARLDVNLETGSRFVVLQDGRRYQGEEGVSDYSISKFSEYGVRMPDVQPVGTKVSLSARSSASLWQSDNLRERAELQYRIAAPISVFVLMLLSIPLAKSAPREGVYGRLTIAIIIYALYMNLVKVAEDWMAKGVMPEYLGLWWLLLVFVLLSVFITYVDSIGFKVYWQRLRVISR